jgi:actin-related protein
MQKELENLLPKSMRKSDVKVVAPRNRKYLAWFGCSLFASLQSFPETCMWKFEYDEGNRDMEKFL